MNPEIENLINMALADGDVKEKERGIILRKAESLGLDKDEVELILDGKIALYNKQANTISHPKSIKEGNLRKCPACGATVPSFNVKCNDCDHEFRNVEENRIVQIFFEKFNKIPEEIFASKETGIFADTDYSLEKKIKQRQSDLINSFPIPNTKEEIIEFLAFAFPLANQKFNWLDRIDSKDTLKKACYSKCEQIVIKARFSFQNDVKTLEEIENYAKQLGIN